MVLECFEIVEIFFRYCWLLCMCRTCEPREPIGPLTLKWGSRVWVPISPLFRNVRILLPDSNSKHGASYYQNIVRSSFSDSQKDRGWDFNKLAKQVLCCLLINIGMRMAEFILRLV